MIPRRVFILKNVPLGSPMPLSIYLTGFLENLGPLSPYELNTITGPPELHGNLNIAGVTEQFYISSALYSVIGNLKFTLSSLRILIWRNRQRPIDLIHCFYPNSSLLAAVLFKLLTASKAKILYDIRSPWIEMIFAMKHLSHFWYPALKTLLTVEEAVLARAVDHFVFVTQGLADYYFKTYRLPRNAPYSVLGSAADMQRFSPQPSGLRTRLGIGPDATIIGYTGTFARARCLDQFITWFAQAAGTQPDIHLVLVGSGEHEAELKRQAVSYNLQRRVHFIGAVPFNSMPEIINGFDLGLCHYPSTLVYEYNHPLKIVEFLACGVPVLASDTAAHRELAAHTAGIHVYDSAKTLEALLANPMKKIVPNLTHFSWENSVTRYREIYDRMFEPAQVSRS